jgi:Mycothiol maleylpyruvate isomerase N-terminal domain
MSTGAVEPLDEEIGRARELITSLTDEEWGLASGCAGWRVQDVVTHMACVLHVIADPSTIEPGTSEDAEANAEIPVRARRDLAPAAVVDEYERWCGPGRDALVGMQAPGIAETVVPLGNLGAHPLHLLANAIVFDHYCHLRHDIGAAVPRAADLPRDEAALEATLVWMLAGLPQMCADALGGCDTGVNLVLDGPGGGRWSLQPGTPWTVEPALDPALPTATSTPHDFVAWGTKRRDWRHAGVRLDDDAGVPALDAINVI